MWKTSSNNGMVNVSVGFLHKKRKKKLLMHGQFEEIVPINGNFELRLMKNRILMLGKSPNEMGT